MAAAVATTSRRGPGGGGWPIDDENLNFETSVGVEVVGSFDAMSIHDELLRGIYGYGFEKPSAIQQRAVLPIITGPVRDRQDLHDLPLRLPDRRHLRPRSAGIDTVAY